MFSKKIIDNLARSSWIRAMFEEGEKLSLIHGADKVFDFSIGNPEIEPPFAVKEKLKQLVLENKPGMHKYMVNPGYKDVREKVAAYLQKENGILWIFENIKYSLSSIINNSLIIKISFIIFYLIR